MGAVNDPTDAGAGGLLRIRTLGDVNLEYVVDGEVRGTLGVGKPVALVAYLACSPRRAESRDHLVDLLWSDVDAEAARHSLRQSVWYLKRRLGAPILSSDSDRVVLLPTISFDRDELLGAVQRGELSTADMLYRGDFFAGFATPGGAEFEHWADGERQRLRSAWMRCLEGLVASHVSAGRFREGQATARRLRDADPLRQASWRLLIEALLAGRDQLGATLEADALAALLAREEHEADPHTRRVLRSVTQSVAQPTAAADISAGTVATDLIGREREFAELLSHWESTRLGATRVAALVGGAGIGKSRLLIDLASRLKAARARVVQVRASAAAIDIGYSFAGDVVGALSQLPGAIAVPEAVAATLVAINPAVASMFPRALADNSTGDDAMRRRVLAIRELLMAVSEEQPVALLLDDLHWSDSSTRRLLAAAFAGLSSARVMLVVTSRVPVREFGALDAAVVRIDPLAVDDVVTMLASIARLPNEPWGDALVSDLHRASDGVPLLLLETIQLALERGALSVGQGNWQRRDIDGLQSLLNGDNAIVRRIASVDDADRPLLLLLAVAALPLSLAAITAALPTIDAPESRLRILEDRGLVVREESRWRIVHDEYGALLQRNAAPEELRTMHAAVGRTELRAASDEHAEARAIAHLTVAGELAPLGAVLTRRVEQARRMRDVRSTKMIARDMLGPDASAAIVNELAGRVPVLVRIGLVTRVRAASLLGVLALALTSASLALRPSQAGEPPRDEPRLALLRASSDDASSDGRFDIFELPIPTNDAELRLASRPITTVARFDPRGFFGAGLSRSGWLFTRISRDSGRMDIYEHRIDGSERRLSFDPADDHDPVMSPDGRTLLFSTGRYDRESDHDDVAAMTLATRGVRRLTQRASIDNRPLWSPDGSRIAYQSNDFDRAGMTLCVLDVDASTERCHARDRIQRLVGWVSSTQLLLQDASPGTLSYIDVATWQEHASNLEASDVSLSPDGAWLVCRCRVGGYHDSEWWVAPINNLSAKRLIRVAGVDPAKAEFGWMPGSRGPRYLDTLQLIPRLTPIPAQTSFAMGFRAVDSRGRPIRDVPLRWSISDTTVATVDSLGVLRTRRPGRVTVTVTAGGWRTAQLSVDVSAPQSRTVAFSERWSAQWADNWYTFGSPRPVVAERLGERWLFPNGDGRFVSGVITREALPVSGGLELETSVTIPVRHRQWQAINIGFVAYRPPKTLASIIHPERDPSPDAEADASCTFGYPSDQEGFHYGRYFALGLQHPNVQHWGLADSAMRRGDRTTLSLRLNADGRCELRAGQQVLASAPAERVDPTLRYHIQIAGQSRWDRNAVGPVTVFQNPASR